MLPITKKAPKSLLVIDIGLIEIQTHLIERNDDVYRWAGVGRASTTLSMTGSVTWKCLVNAMQQLELTTDHKLLGSESEVISPENGQGLGVDRICLTWSLPVSIKAILFGLTSGFSISNAQCLLEGMPVEVVNLMSATDGRSDKEKMDILLSQRPDLIVLTGGVDGGGIQVLKDVIDLLVHSFTPLPQELRPEILFTGNTSVSEYLIARVKPIMKLYVAPNIQPSTDVLDLQPARETLADICNRIWMKQHKLQTGSHPLKYDHVRPVTLAMEDFITIQGLCKKTNGGLAMVMNGLFTSISASLDGHSTSHQYLNTCVGLDAEQLIEKFPLEDVANWMPCDITRDDLTEYLVSEFLYPGRLPVTGATDALYGGVARLTGKRTWRGICGKQDFPDQLVARSGGAQVDSILVSGPRMYQYQNYNTVLLEMLDVLQPVGIFEVYIDREGLAAGLGTAAQVDPRIPVHCILGHAVPKLATVIAPAYKGREDIRILTVTVISQDGHEITCEINSGKLISIPLGTDEQVEIRIRAEHGARLFESGHTLKITIPTSGSVMGIVVDTRGRPMKVQKGLQKQQAWIKRSIIEAQEMAR
ncbi:MAG: glutamate mutase L [Anaerolineaceae bacterium]|nr:glutamate mutase L [Anaerolineaceae bacterium]